jgi:uncharacterized protein YuzE
MSITVGDITFDDTSYDARGDVLYLNVGAPTPAAVTLATPEGHAVDYDEHGHVIGLTLVNVRWLLESEGAVTVTWPAARIEAEQLRGALAAAG